MSRIFDHSIGSLRDFSAVETAEHRGCLRGGGCGGGFEYNAYADSFFAMLATCLP
jgi:hypothetical protein